LPELATVYAEDVPVFRGRYGQSNGRNAVRFHVQAGRRERRSAGDHSPEKNPA
jgi:flagellar motor switch protein FliM